MSNQNRFLLPHATSGGAANATASSGSTTTSSSSRAGSSSSHQALNEDEGSNQHSVDTDFDSYWEEEARNPHRNRIRIGRQYQATVTPLLKSGERDQRKLEELETLSFCPKRSAKVSNAELDHYFTVAKSLNLFASLVETRSLLGRDVTIADLNHIRNKEGLSLASVIQPVRQTASSSSISPPSSQHQNHHTTGQQSPLKSPANNCDNPNASPSGSPKSLTASLENCALNQPLMKALSHFISLHHPCHHDQNCKKLLKDFPLETEPVSAVSITAGNLRQSSSYKEARASKSRAAKQALLLQQQQQQAAAAMSKDESEKSQDQESQENQFSGDNAQADQSPSYEDWTREEVELFSKAIEVCGKNFGSIKKEFLPSKSVRSIVEYYYIGSRDVSEPKRKSNQTVDSSDGCSSPEKLMANNNSQGGGGSSTSGGKNGSNPQNLSNQPASSTSSSSAASRNANSKPNSNSTKTISDSAPADLTIDASKTSGQVKLEQDIPTSPLEGPKQAKGSSNNKSIDVYNFDDEIKEDASSPIRFECPRPGTEVKPLKAKPIVPNSSSDADASNSNVGSLKFFMDGQLVLKLNACQEQQGEGNEKCHWVQSGDKVINTNRQKRYSKRANSEHNGSQSNSVISSNQDEDSKQDDLTGDEDSKESMGSFTQQPPPPSTPQKNQSPASKRLKAVKGESNSNKTPSPTSLHQFNQQQQQLIQHHHQQQLSQPIDYNRLAVNNRMKERNDNLLQQQQQQHSPVINQSAMPWLQANSLAVAAALLGGLPFPQAPPPAQPPHSLITGVANNMNSNNTNHNNNNSAANSIGSNQVTLNNNNDDGNHMSSANAASTKPMDLSSAAPIQKPVQKSTSRSRRPKNSS